MSITSYKRKNRKALRTAQWPQDPKKMGITKVSVDDLKELHEHIKGEVVLPCDPDYDKAREGNPLYPAFPKVIVYCEAFEDVRICLEVARQHGLWVTCRSGGHSTAGYSVNDGMVLDLSRISYTCIDPVLRRARVGVGTPFDLLNSTLDTYHLHVPSGTCPDVCVGGYTQGGGYGLTAREFGITCDSVVESLVMLADGRIVIASPETNPDLHWAVRGGTGNNFGVVLEVTYRLQELRMVFGYAYSWPLAQAPDVLAKLQGEYMAHGGDDKVGYLTVLTVLDDQPVVTVIGMYHGSEAQGRAALKSLLSVGTPKGLATTMGTYADLNDSLFSVLPGPGTPGTMEMKRARYVKKMLSTSDWKTICDYFTTSKNPFNIAVIEPYGGRINAVPTLGNAFVHREVSMDFFVDSFWNSQWPNCPDQKTASDWLDGFFRAVEPLVENHVYQNYPERGSADYRWMYWGDAYPSLLFVKKKYDPTNFFQFEQSISPYPNDPHIHRSRAESMFRDPVIVYPSWSTG